MRSFESHSRPRVAVLGAGPVGLEAALAARERGLPVKVYEAAPQPAAHVRGWGHVRLFTPWRMNVSDRMRLALEEAGRPLEADPEETPTGHEYADRVLDPLWRLPELARALKTDTRVVAVGREGTLKHEEIGGGRRRERPFRILVADEAGRERVEHAEVVLDCTGKWGNPNPLGDGGIRAPGESVVENLITRRIPSPEELENRWAGRRTLLVGAGHSAQTAARALAGVASRHQATRVFWAVRSEDPDWGAVSDDPLPERRRLTDDARTLAEGASPAVALRTGVVVEALESTDSGARVELRGPDGEKEAVTVDRILSLTGGVGDHTLYRQLQVHECYATCGPMKLSAALLGQESADCLDQEAHGAETLMNPEPEFFILGDKSYGRNNTFLLQIGWSQVTEVFGAMDS